MRAACPLKIVRRAIASRYGQCHVDYPVASALCWTGQAGPTGHIRRIRPLTTSSTLCKNRACLKDIVVAFRGQAWAFLIADCSRLLLKPSQGMNVWRRWAQKNQPGSSPAVVAELPVVVCKQGAAVNGADFSGTPRELCDACRCRRKRVAGRQATGPSFHELSIKPPPVSAPLLSAGSQLMHISS